MCNWIEENQLTSAFKPFVCIRIRKVQDNALFTMRALATVTQRCNVGKKLYERSEVLFTDIGLATSRRVSKIYLCIQTFRLYWDLGIPRLHTARRNGRSHFHKWLQQKHAIIIRMMVDAEEVSIYRLTNN